MTKNICLIGNPNCGKTTLFNVLTGSYEKVGNRAGVTVEEKSARLKGQEEITVTDLPGLYSLSADSLDEKAVSRFLKSGKADVIVSVIDGTNPERGLLLTAELLKLSLPMAIAVNFCDELDKNGIKFDDLKLSEAFNVPVVKISARKGINVDELKKVAINESKKPTLSEISPEKVRRLSASLTNGKPTAAELFTDKADKILTSKIWGLPIFFAVAFVTFFFTLTLGGKIGSLLSEFINGLTDNFYYAIVKNDKNVWFADLLCNAVIGGIGNVVSFLPQIIILFFFLTVLEQTGYTSRAAFLTDDLLSKIGLCGKSAFSFGLSCGCAVSGISSSLTIENKGSRELTVFLTPFMPCGAKTAVFAYLCGVLFGGNALIAATTYIVSVFAVAICGKILSKFKRFNTGGGLIMEMPTLRLPSKRVIYGAVRDKTLDFLLKAGTVIFGVSVVLWGLKNFGITGYVGGNTQESFLYYIGNAVKYVFYPLGFGNWESSVAILSGILAKEAVIESLSAVTTDPSSLFASGYSAYAFMVFILLMPPCVAALSTAKRELKDKKLFWIMVLFQTVTAYVFALCINLFGVLSSIIGNFAVIGLTLIVAAAIISLKRIFKPNVCEGCKNCKKIKGNCQTARKAS